MNDRDLVKAFIAYLREHGFPDLKVDIWPEDENRNSPDIEAIAGAIAIECTSIDTLPNQRRDSDWFFQVVNGLQKELPFQITFRLNITFEYGALRKGQDWAAIRHGLKDWVIKEARCLPEGRHVIDGVLKVPFRLHVQKAHNRRPGITFGRFKPEDDTLVNRIRELFDDKANKLNKYQKSGKTTVLLIDGFDFVLMNEWIMLQAIQDAYPNGLPRGVDQIWYADTSTPTEIEFTDLTQDLQ